MKAKSTVKPQQKRFQLYKKINRGKRLMHISSIAAETLQEAIDGFIANRREWKENEEGFLQVYKVTEEIIATAVGL